MRVARYTKDIQYKIGCRVDAEPWMHIVFEKFKPTSNSKDNSVAFAVYVWDTRKVLGTGFTRPENYELGASAKDNHKPLQGGDRVVEIIGCNRTWAMQSKDYKNAAKRAMKQSNDDKRSNDDSKAVLNTAAKLLGAGWHMTYDKTWGALFAHRIVKARSSWTHTSYANKANPNGTSASKSEDKDLTKLAVDLYRTTPVKFVEVSEVGNQFARADDKGSRHVSVDGPKPENYDK